ncbi:MAG: NUDIX domain-containing protein [Woeseiaceae bacterium]|nr:NUDIX domain-containing protein [Woeseiaceae bacterium]
MPKPTEIAAASPSSTVVLVRDAPDAPEIYLVRRRRDASAWGGAYVFPGGVLEETDRRVSACCRGLSEADANRLLCVRQQGLAWYSAAIRELFEETGVLLADHELAPDEVAAARDALNAASLDWQAWLQRHDVALRCDRLKYFSHWITPDIFPRRYTTRFFLARMPQDQSAGHDGVELTDARWLSAERALIAASAGELSLRFPTIRTLEQLRPHASGDELLRWAEQCERDGVETIYPVMPDGQRRAAPQLRIVTGVE